LLPIEYLQLGKHVAASAGFVENFLLWSEAGYFDTKSILKPLLHIWSLGIEEQFYIVWPLILWAAWKRKISLLWVTISIAAISFAADIILTSAHPGAAFYFPMTRFWELLIGATLAHLTIYRPLALGRFSNLKSAIGLLLVTWSIFETSRVNFPGWQALIPTIGAALIISAGPGAAINLRLLSVAPMRWTGLISYPLYLWHWSLFSFSRIVNGAPLPVWIEIAILFIAVALAAVTFRFIETPVRNSPARLLRVATSLAAASLALGVIGVVVFLNDGFSARSDAQAYNDPSSPNETLSTAACADRYGYLYSGGFIQDRDICIFEERSKPTDIMIIGDSHALRLYEAFVALGVDGVTVLGRGSCAPILNAPNVAWLKCQPVNDRIIDFATASKAGTLILTGVFERYFDGTYGNDIPISDIETDIQKIFAKLAASQKKVTIVIDNPSLPFEARSCFRRPLTVNPPKDCSFARDFYDDKSQRYRELFRKYATIYPAVKLIDASEYFCDDRRCFAYNKDGMLYSGDNNHLNMRGAILVARSAMASIP
jgi:hypothetical protein